ncbi:MULTISPECIES: SDR family NAD(P)-dependent oxidoreductase [unclassified Paraburkholderia]|uniref:SDR family NAD(P)-dependent oxidoreductase n=1 Tax=unclassified Paraburkholderia TaxID=2615204 RepID=UPI002158AFF1|nr:MULTISPECIES: SDR family NAD(P)-dependent oxidoreductase [unclassified Paraburkholderia]
MKDKVAVVTGGESGIGLEISKGLAQAGAHVVLAGILEDLGTKAEASIREAGGKAEFIKVDVRSSSAINALISGVHERLGRLDVLVNNAGVSDGAAKCLETSDELWDLVLDINLRGAFFATRAALAVMVPQRSGRIVNVASVAALRVQVNGLPYTVSKFGMTGLTRHTATHYAESGVTINAICPGFTVTEMRDNSARIVGDVAPPMDRAVGASPDAFKKFVPAQRRGSVGEIAALALFFSSDAASYITGQVVAVDGGWSAS